MKNEKQNDFLNKSLSLVQKYTLEKAGVVIGAGTGGAVGGFSGASLGTGIGMVVAGPLGAGIGFGVGSLLGTGTGVAAGAVSGKKMTEVFNNQLKEI